MAGLLRILFFLWCIMDAMAQSGSCKGSGNCNVDGSSTTYTETIQGEVREIRASGCPNNNPVDVCIGDNPNPANTQDWQFDIPAIPMLNAGTYAASLNSALSLSALGGIIGITRNGIEIRSCYGGATYGPCTDYASSATAVESDTFEYCRGHGNPYHYHEAPVCLLQQMGVRSDGSSPLVGWAADGFPIYGNLGPGGVEIKRCGAVGAHSTYCMDSCGGYYGSDYSDDFTYRYFMAGPTTIPSVSAGRSPASTLQESDGYFPFVPICLLGCGSVRATSNERNPAIGQRMPACGAAASSGTVSGYTATALAGVTNSYSPQIGSVVTSPTPTPAVTASPSPSPSPTSSSSPPPSPSPSPSTLPVPSPTPSPSPSPSSRPAQSADNASGLLSVPMSWGLSLLLFATCT